ncbi:Protein of unknown function [Sphingomonas palmae]|uniref:Lipopolysaccharide assembly protein A domain-containing protein n=1 Tax=Sphingomonas palmae TaxID=1855283 RepID=A0A1H7GC96_9SPHN|nr:lipopolysaccharide assembly protein LapA domain-containing protein [Sphingomonas palmae]SEK35749.1 Protein of unknown function [Sphingomonas palmae]
MQFLKILFWCLLAFIAAVFTFGNWTTVSIQLFGDLVMEINLPLLLLLTFLLGFLPTLIYQHVIRWRLRQRLAAAERALASTRAISEAAFPEQAPPPPPPPPAATSPEAV